MTESNELQRVTLKRPHNQYVQELLENLYRDALRAQSDIVPSVRKAITSLSKYPMLITSGSQCAILKGFDEKMCNYIDLHLKKQSKNKRVKVCEEEDSNDEFSQPSTSVDESSDSGMSGSSDKYLEKELIEEKIPVLNNSKPTTMSAKNGEKNNNSATSNCLDNGGCSGAEALDTYFVNKSREDASLNNASLAETSNKLQTPIDAHLALSSKWSSFPNADCNKFKNKFFDIQFASSHEYDEMIYSSEEEDTSDEYSSLEMNVSSDEEDLPQPAVETNSQCLHCTQNGNNQQCDCKIKAAANAFKKYFNKKMQKDDEEIKKCVLPRKLYKPAYRSGAYAILVALLEQRNECPYRDRLTKEELIQKAQNHTDQFFTNPIPDSNYTAWTNAKRLISKGMIQIINCQHRNEEFYLLTAMGRAVAMDLVKEHTPIVTVNDVIFHKQRNDRVPSLADLVLVPPPPIALVNEDQSSLFIEMPPGTFDIVMLIDKREHCLKHLPASPNRLCKYETRNLTLGDILWVARSKKTGQELVLPYIIERKTLGDLSSSIKDGRFHEQKFRLRKCGLKKIYYLVENFGLQKTYSLPTSTLMQAVINTGIQDEFNVIKTEGQKQTFMFLAKMSEKLVHDILPMVLRGCNRDTQGKELMTFEFFNKFASKNRPLSIRDLFIKLLLQLKGLSVEKALAITNKYCSPSMLMKAYDRCTEKEGLLLLATLKLNMFSRSTGPAVSKTVYKLFSKLRPQ